MMSMFRAQKCAHVSLLFPRFLSTSSNLNASNYKAVIFDMGGVILPSPFKAAYKWEKNHGIEPGTIFSAIKHNKNVGAWSQLERGELSLEQFYSPFAKEVSNLLPSDKTVNSEMIENFMNNLTSELVKVSLFFVVMGRVAKS